MATAPERPDNSLFMVMMGVFFIIFSLPAFYWAFYNFGEYRQTTDLIKGINRNFEGNSTPGAGESSERIPYLISSANRYRLEMLGSGVGGLVLLGISGLFFRKFLAMRGQMTAYAHLDPRTISPPGAPIEIRYRKLHGVLTVAVILFFALAVLFIVYQNFTNPFLNTENAIIRSLIFAVPFGLFLSIFAFLHIRARRNALKIIDASGFTRGDGRHFAWAEFRGAITRMARTRHGKPYAWRTELAFSEGETAWLIAPRIHNYEEVFGYVDGLPKATPKS